MTLRRRPPRRDPLPRILIVSEGQSEADYVHHLKAALAAGIIEIVLVPRAGVPKSVVEVAAERFNRARREAKRMRAPELVYDEVWCIFDVDAHPMLLEAKQQARDNGFGLAISNPCFELWLLMHFEDQRAHIERNRVQARVRAHLPRYEKRIDAAIFAVLSPCLENAQQRAAATDQWHSTRGTSGDNASTQFYSLTERISTMARDRRLNRPE